MSARELVEAELSQAVIDAFFRVYNRLGFGFLESVYALAMEIELRRLGLRVAREVAVRVYYDGIELCQYRVDMLVEGKAPR